MKRIVLHWPRLGPYHLARLRGAHESFSARGVTVTALEIAGMDRTYGWKKEEQETAFERRTLFPDRYYEDLNDVEMKEAIFAALDQLAPQAVAINGYGFRDSRLCLDWCSASGTKAILMTETTAADKPRVWLREVAKRVLLRRFDAAICGGRRHRNYLLSLGQPPYRVFTKYDVVDNDYFATPGPKQPGMDLPGLDDARPFFLSSNRFIARKNMPTLLRAYADYRASSPDGWRLVLLGSGEEEADLRKLTADLQIPDVTFAGFRQIEELPFYYAAAGCFVHPALTEPWGLVVNEAMAAGLPVIVSTGAGCSDDLVEHGSNGFVFDATNTNELAQCMRTLAGDTDLQARMRVRSREIIATWTIHNFASELWKAWQAPRVFYRLVRIGRRNVVAYPEGSRTARLHHLACIRPVTARQQLFIGVITMLIRLRCDRFFSKRSAPDDPENFSSDLANALRDISARLNHDELCYTITWPSERRRKRTYAFALLSGGESIAFIKMSEASEMETLQNGFNALTELANLRNGKTHFPRPLFIGNCGGIDYHVSQCVPTERGRLVPSSVDPKVHIDAYAGPLFTVSPAELAEATWVRQFWNVVDKDGRFAISIANDFHHPVQCCRVHGDLTRANMILSGETMWIIDWELSDPAGPWLTDYVTFFLGERQRRLVRDPQQVLAEFRHEFFEGRTADEQRNARLALAFLLARRSGLGVRVAAAWDASR